MPVGYSLDRAANQDTRDPKVDHPEARIIRLSLNERSLMRGTFAGLDYGRRQGRVAKRGYRTKAVLHLSPKRTKHQLLTCDLGDVSQTWFAKCHTVRLEQWLKTAWDMYGKSWMLIALAFYLLPLGDGRSGMDRTSATHQLDARCRDVVPRRSCRGGRRAKRRVPLTRYKRKRPWLRQFNLLRISDRQADPGTFCALIKDC